MPAACGFLPTTAKPILNMCFILEINLLVCYNMVMSLKVHKRARSQTKLRIVDSFPSEQNFVFLKLGYFYSYCHQPWLSGTWTGREEDWSRAWRGGEDVSGWEGEQVWKDLGICWCRGWTRVAVEAIIQHYSPHSHSFHFLLTCVSGGLSNYFVSVSHEAFSPLFSQGELSWADSRDSRPGCASQTLRFRAGQEGWVGMRWGAGKSQS